MIQLSLHRLEFSETGIFGILTEETGIVIAATLEHAFNLLPKIPAGVYLCQRGKHLLHGMTEPFETFEVTGVTGHQGLLFHWGNYNQDSDGCILLGMERRGSMIVNSRQAFQHFMEILSDQERFTLTVRDDLP